MRRLEWFEEAGTPPDGVWWWAVEHRGHPAFYMRSLMAGDFAPGRAPLERHVLGLDGQPVSEVRCGTCDDSGASPSFADELNPIERRTGARRFLDEYRAARAPWPAATDPATCWLCSNRTAPAREDVLVDGKNVKTCEGCAGFLSRGGR